MGWLQEWLLHLKWYEILFGSSGLLVGIKLSLSKKVKSGMRTAWNWGRSKMLMNLDVSLSKHVTDFNEYKEEMRGEVAEIKTMVTSLISETQTNGGSKIKDDLVLIKNTLKSINETVQVENKLSWALRDFSEDGSFLADVNGNITQVSKSVLTILGCPEQDFIKKRFLRFIVDEEQQNKFEYEWVRHFKEEMPFDKTVPMMNNSNERIYFRFSSRPVINNGVIMAFVGSIKQVK